MVSVMLKIALAALWAAGFSTMADAAVVTYTYTYSFEAMDTSFEGNGDDGKGGSLYLSASVTSTMTTPETGTFDVSIDTDIHELAGLQIDWYDDADKGITTTLPGVGMRTMAFGQDGMPEYWDLYIETTSAQWNYYSGGDYFGTGEYISFDGLVDTLLPISLPDEAEGYGMLVTRKYGPGGTWSVSGNEISMEAPLPAPLPASALLLVGGIGMLAAMRRGMRRA